MWGAQEWYDAAVGAIDTISQTYFKILAPIRRMLTGYIKLLLSFYQVGSSFGKTFRIEWPDTLQNMFRSVAVFNLDVISLPGPACIVARSHIRGVA